MDMKKNIIRRGSPDNPDKPHYSNTIKVVENSDITKSKSPTCIKVIFPRKTSNKERKNEIPAHLVKSKPVSSVLKGKLTHEKYMKTKNISAKPKYSSKGRMNLNPKSNGVSANPSDTFSPGSSSVKQERRVSAKLGKFSIYEKSKTSPGIKRIEKKFKLINKKTKDKAEEELEDILASSTPTNPNTKEILSKTTRNSLKAQKQFTGRLKMRKSVPKSGGASNIKSVEMIETLKYAAKIKQSLGR